MDSKMGADKNHMNNFEPSSDLIKEDECDTLLLYLPGFKKEHLRVQLAKSGILRISGTSPLGGNKSSTFQKDFPVSPNCDTTKITAKFEGGILYVKQPKLIVPAKEQDTKPPLLEVPQPDHKPDEKTPSKNKDEDQPQTSSPKTTPREDPHQIKPEKTVVQNEEQKFAKEDEEKSSALEDEEKSSALEDEKKGEQKGSLVDEREKGSEQNAISKVDEYKKMNEGSVAAAKLKKARQVLNFVLMLLALLFAFAFGMYVNKPVSKQESQN